MLEYIIGRSCGRFLPPNQLLNRRFRRPSFIRKQKIDDPESWFKANIHDRSCGIKNNMLNRLNTQQFLNCDIPIEPYDDLSRVSKIAEVKRLILHLYGPSATLDNLLRGIEIFASDPECIDMLDEYIAVLRKNCKYYDDLMQLSN
jgi:hypothetical protein